MPKRGGKKSRNERLRKQARRELVKKFSDISSTSSDSSITEPPYNFDKWLTLPKEEEFSDSIDSGNKPPSPGLSGRLDQDTPESPKKEPSPLHKTAIYSSFRTYKSPFSRSSGRQNRNRRNTKQLSYFTSLPEMIRDPTKETRRRRKEKLFLKTHGSLSANTFTSASKLNKKIEGGKELKEFERSSGIRDSVVSNTSRFGRQGRFRRKSSEMSRSSRSNGLTSSLFSSNTPPLPGLSERQDRFCEESPEMSPSSPSNNSSSDFSSRSDTSSFSESARIVDLTYRDSKLLSYSTPLPGVSGLCWKRYDSSSD